MTVIPETRRATKFYIHVCIITGYLLNTSPAIAALSEKL